ncbi:MAG: 3-oxoacyl-ACP reductase FabG, partial [Pseudomonadota bacterium]|nr:3-oxoacyl-ACP reductase FabG [Pseudomonadota bacterium]
MSQICLVTGASRGIGKAIALELATQGHTVIGTGTSPASAENVTTDLRAARAQGRGAVLDVNDLQQIKSVINEITDEFGPISVLVNNAGVTEDNLLMRMKPSQWEKTLNTNLAAVFALTKLCLKGMTKARYGRIINLSSVVGATGNAGQTNYAASKAGLIGFTKSLALEIASRGITVNAVAPGFIDTDMTSALAEEQRSKLLESIPLARLGR